MNLFGVAMCPLKARDCVSQGEEVPTLGNNSQVLSQFSLLSAHTSQPIVQMGGNGNGGRDKSVLEGCDSELITSVREFLR